MSQPLHNSLREIEARVRAAERLMLFMDFDGTLAPMTPDPELARISESTRKALTRLSQEDVVVAVISGRSLGDVRRRVGVDGLIYAGNHGLEIDGPHISFVDSDAAPLSAPLKRLTESLTKDLRTIAGVRVEFKGLTTSVHYRAAGAADLPRIERIVQRALRPVETFLLVRGNKVLEILPRTGWNKGSAVRWISDHFVGRGAQLCLCFGDDRTDEDVFAALPDGVTVKVGESEGTRARYRASGPAAVYDFLLWLEAAVLSIRLGNRHVANGC